MRKATNAEFSEAWRVLKGVEMYLANKYPDACKVEASYGRSILLECGWYVPGYDYCIREAIKATAACRDLMFAGKREEIEE